MKKKRRDGCSEVPRDDSKRGRLWLWSAVGTASILLVGLGVYAAVGGFQFRSGEKVHAAEVGRHDSGSDPAAPAFPPCKGPPGPAPEGMVWIPGGTFWMGSDDERMPDAKPVHQVSVDGFFIDKTEVTNRQFERFVRATAYITVAERKPDPKDFPDVPPQKLVSGSIVFTPPSEDVSYDNPLVWWRYVPGASWRHPEGPDRSIQGREDHPVVHVCWDDASAYAKWAGKRLPTEAEWEYAARGGLERKRYVWGDELLPGGKWQVNNWQGRFPRQNTAADGFLRTAPVASFPPNGFGLYDMAGNVWEWCADWYRPGYNTEDKTNPQGPSSSYGPIESDVRKRVQRGGSFLCSDLYCSRYLPGGRGKGAPDSEASNLGFRCVLSPSQPYADPNGVEK
jgi:formylglycine-generating enzyme